MDIAIVTGASSGMGKEFVMQLSAYVKVDEIWVIARRTEALEALKQQVCIPVRTVALDLCREDSFESYRKLLETETPNVKLLVNAAGFGKFGYFEKVSVTEETPKIISHGSDRFVTAV